MRSKREDGVTRRVKRGEQKEKWGREHKQSKQGKQFKCSLGKQLKFHKKFM